MRLCHITATFAGGLLLAVLGPATACAAESSSIYDLEIVVQGTPPAIDQYTEVKVPLVVRNAGTRRWNTQTFRVAYHWYSTSGETVVWDGVRTQLPRDVGPGETAQVSATLAAPPRSGALRLQWDVVEESVAWVSEKDPTPPPVVPVTVVAKLPRHAFSFTRRDSIRFMSAGSTRRLPVVVRNDGSEQWAAGKPIHVSYHWIARNAADSVYEGVRTPVDSAIGPGESAEVQVVLEAPQVPGLYRLQWDMVHEGVVWFSRSDPTPENAFRVVVLPA